MPHDIRVATIRWEDDAVRLVPSLEFRRYSHRRPSNPTPSDGWLLYIGRRSGETMFAVVGWHHMTYRDEDARWLELTFYPHTRQRRVGSRCYHRGALHVHLPARIMPWVSVIAGPAHFELHLGLACRVDLWRCRRQLCWQGWLWWRTIGRRA